jgi:hypothetical protein
MGGGKASDWSRKTTYGDTNVETKFLRPPTEVSRIGAPQQAPPNESFRQIEDALSSKVPTASRIYKSLSPIDFSLV